MKDNEQPKKKGNVKLGIAFFATGFVLCLSTVWVASYVIGTLPIGHWSHFPTIITAIGAFLLGGGLCLVGSMEIEGYENE